MKNIAIVGGFAGDEAKGRVTHDLSPQYDWIVRFSGGNNAGHTIYRDGKKYVHNLLPSFDWRSDKPRAFLGSGMVIDLLALHSEVKDLYAINPSLPSRIFVDPDAFLVLEKHQQEDKKLNGHIGSTNRGIGPAYKDKIGRTGVRIRDYLQNIPSDIWQQKAISQLQKMGVHFKNVLELRPEMEKQKILFEGAQGILLDINHGTYPYVSCGDSTIAGIYASGFNFVKLDKVYGVVKCYATRVGEGPFPTEMFGKESEELRARGNEYGATTGRPRRVGWLDLPALQYAIAKGSITDLIVTKFDILNKMETIPVAIAYDKTPTCSSDFFNAKVHYEKFPGWNDCKNMKEIEPFISKIEKFTNCKVAYISCGVNPEDLIDWQAYKHFSWRNNEYYID